MRTHPPHSLSCLGGALLALIAWGTPAAFADTTVTLDQPIHFTTAEGSDVLLDAGSYAVEAAEEWLKITPSEGRTMDALLLEAQAGSHEETLTLH